MEKSEEPQHGDRHSTGMTKEADVRPKSPGRIRKTHNGESIPIKMRNTITYVRIAEPTAYRFCTNFAQKRTPNRTRWGRSLALRDTLGPQMGRVLNVKTETKTRDKMEERSGAAPPPPRGAPRGGGGARGFRIQRRGYLGVGGRRLRGGRCWGRRRDSAGGQTSAGRGGARPPRLATTGNTGALKTTRRCFAFFSGCFLGSFLDLVVFFLVFRMYWCVFLWGLRFFFGCVFSV